MQGLTDVLWVEKYRPTRLEQLALEEDTRNILQSYLDAGEIPHLLLVGPPGSGKTTVARILTAQLDCRVLSLNASSDRGIDVIRGKIAQFVTAASGARWNIPFLDEADALTPDAQTALRNLIESWAARSRFILTANYVHRLIGAIQSRCQLLTLNPPPLKERYRVLASVLASEGITAGPKIILGYAERYTDMRRMLMGAQRAYLANAQSGELPALTTVEDVNGLTILQYIEGKNWTALRQLAAREDFDPVRGLMDVFWAVPDVHPRVGFLRHILGRGVHESGFSPDPRILFLGVTAEACEGL